MARDPMRFIKTSKTIQQIAMLVVFCAVIVFFIQLCSAESEPGKAPPEEVIGSTNDKELAFSEYQLSFSSTFDPGLAAQDDLGLSVVIAVDCSGSMSETISAPQAPSTATAIGKGRPSSRVAKYIIASQSLTEIVKFLESLYTTRLKPENTPLKVGILRFEEEVRELFPLTAMDSASFSRLRAITANPANFKPNGRTAIGTTLAQGAEMLAQSGTIFRSLIVISDGENTTGDTPEQVLEAIVENRNSASTPDFPVFTRNILVSFVGFDMDAAVFASLRTIGSRVVSARDQAELEGTLKAIFLADVSRFEAAPQ